MSFFGVQKTKNAGDLLYSLTTYNVQTLALDAVVYLIL